MYQYIITLESYDEMAKEVLNKVQLIMWRLKVRALLSILPNRIINKAIKVNKELSFEKYFDNPYKKIIKEVSEDKSVLEERNKEVQDFLYSNWAEYLKNEKEIKAITDDRIMSKLKAKVIRLKDKITDKAIKKNIGTTTVIAGFNVLGVAINSEVKEKQ